MEFEPKKCVSLPDFINKVRHKMNRGWIFRGQKTDCWSLKHSFERACERFFVPQEERVRIEHNMVREFKRRLHHYVTNLPEKDAYDEWIALMQHHGAPTRLIDCTYSPYVAAYFAFEFAEPKTNIAIWAINVDWFRDKLESISEDLLEKYNKYREDREKFGKNFIDIFAPQKPYKLLLAINPFRLNERLAYQRGVFLCPGDVSVSLEENLTIYPFTELQNNIIKYIIPTGDNNGNTIKALDFLDSMNISRITLFPGLDGFAQSFEPRIRPLFLRQYLK